MKGRVYCVDIASTSLSAATDLVEITPADDKPVSIVGIFLFQTSDLGDAQEEVRAIQIIRGNTTSGSGGSTPTPIPLQHADAAAGFTVETVNTTVAADGTPVTLLTDGWNVRLPYLFQPIDDLMTPSASQANTTLVVRLDTPADAITVRGSVWVREE
jgi:hypothetical protein